MKRSWAESARNETRRGIQLCVDHNTQYTTVQTDRQDRTGETTVESVLQMVAPKKQKAKRTLMA